MGFWANVEREREYQGITRKELAFRANIAYQGIGLGLERNSMPGADTAIRVSKVLNVPIEYLLGEENATIRDENATLKKTLSDSEIKMKNIELYKKNQTVISSLEKIPLHIKEPIISMIHRIASNIHESALPEESGI